MKNNHYHFHSARLAFRSWQQTDLPALHQINSNPTVMEYFPALLSLDETKDFMDRMNQFFEQSGYCYFAVDSLETRDLIGFIGLCFQDFESPFTPCIDIGWRLHPRFWGRGLATEGAMRCLEYGFKELGISQIRAIAPKINNASIAVMMKLGMELAGIFSHPKLKEYPHLESCVCYQSDLENFMS